MTKSGSSTRRIGFLLCMQQAEAEFFRVLLGGFEPAWMSRVGNLRDLSEKLERLRGPARLISFCSDIILSGAIIDRLDGQCFNFHPGPPERPGYRPAAFAAADRDRSFGVTFHSMIEEVDDGPIYALRRFSLDDADDEEAISAAAHGHLLWLAAEVADGLGDPTHRFDRLPINWGRPVTSRRDYIALTSPLPDREIASSFAPQATKVSRNRRTGARVTPPLVPKDK
jgi:methionyl-tRNA formyltransferase